MISIIICVILATASCLFLFLINRRRTHNGTIYLPKRCILETGDTDSVIRCLRKIMSRQAKDIILDCGIVESFPYETYITICAQAEKAKDLGKTVSLNFSSTTSLKVLRVLIKDHRTAETFHQHVVSSELLFIQRSKITPDIIGGLSKELKKIGIKDYYELNTLVTEILGNAIEHGIRGSNINWWMYHTKVKGTLKMVFVDMGTGIISSYRKAGIGILLSGSNLLLRALKGAAGSSTKEPNRGRGLPQMDFMIRNNFISNFILITNNVTLRYNNGEYVTSSHPNFVGTYYSWTVNKENFLDGKIG